MKNYVLFVLLGTLLAGCSSSQVIQEKKIPQPVPNHKIIHIGEFDQLGDFKFIYPTKAKFQFNRDDGSIALSTNGGIIDNKLGDYFIAVQKTSPSPHCRNVGIITPVITENKAKDTRLQRGKVDFFDVRGDYYPSEETPRCRPLGGVKIDGAAGGGAAYALCSERHDEEVLICVSQTRDDPVIANKIFDSFEWTN